jgi:hypothetical protein
MQEQRQTWREVTAFHLPASLGAIELRSVLGPTALTNLTTPSKSCPLQHRGVTDRAGRRAPIPHIAYAFVRLGAVQEAAVCVQDYAGRSKSAARISAQAYEEEEDDQSREQRIVKPGLDLLEMRTTMRKLAIVY